jgi:hypothetical protein
MRIGKYEVAHELGAGAMGIVYKAFDPDRLRPVAIKMIGNRWSIHATVHAKQAHDSPAGLDINRRMMLVREARLASELTHPNIVRVFDYGQQAGLLFIVMEYLVGRSLDRFIRMDPPPPMAQKIGIVRQMCEGLAFAHRQGVIHRDVKPANTFVRSDGTVKLLDFGLAAKLTTPQTGKGGIAGTVPYMAPEIILKHGEYDGKVDIWAAGVTMYELVTGKQPFTSPSYSETMSRIVHKPFPALQRNIPKVEEIERILAIALAKDPGQRYPDAAEFALELRRLQDRLDSTDVDFIPSASTSQDGQTQGSTYFQGGFGFDIGLRETTYAVSIEYGKIATRRFVQKIEAIEDLPIFRLWGVMLLVPPIFVATLLVFGLVKLLEVLFAFLELLEGIPHCRGCKYRMSHKSRWTRFAHTNAAFNHGFSDCVAALRENLWEDAAKLLALHGDEYSLAVTNTVVEPPIRFHLDFFECRRCTHQCARITTEDKDDESWIARVEYVHAYKSSTSRDPGREILHGLSQTFRAIFHAASLASPNPDKLRAVFIVLGALVTFWLGGWLIIFVITHAWISLRPRH